MKRFKIILLALVFLWFGISGASGAVINLFDAFLNVDGTISIPGSLAPLGIVQVTINDPGNHFVGLFVDYEIDEATNTFFNEHGALSGGPNFQQSWEIDDPWNGDIFWNFEDSNDVVGSQLDNFNAVPAGMENDVSMALGWDFVLASGDTATVNFLLSQMMPASGFYLSHTDPDSDATIYLTSTLDITPSGVPVPIDIDIKPGSNRNSINLKSKGKIPVAIITTDTFDATTVDPLSVEFGPNGATESHGRGHIEDVDGDGDLDLLLHFKTRETGIQCGDTSASLTGTTFGGVTVEGSDSIKTKGCK